MEKGVPALLRYLAQVQERDQGLRVARVGVGSAGVAEDDHVVVEGHPELVQNPPVRGISHARGDPLVLQPFEGRRGDGAVPGDHGHLRAGMDVVVELGDHRGRAVVPAEYQGALGLRFAGCRFSDGPFVDPGGSRFRELYLAVVFGDEYDFVFRRDPGVGRRV